MKLQKTFYDLFKNQIDYPFYCPLPPFAKAPYLLLQSLAREESPYDGKKLYPYKAIFIVKDQETSNKRLLGNIAKIKKLLTNLPFKGIKIEIKIEEGVKIIFNFFYEEE
jgi:hypothetical protein